MRLRQPFAKKHIHIWRRSFIHDDEYGWVIDLERECTDCGKKQHCRIDRAQKASLPDSVIHLGDFCWKEGELI